MRFSRTNATTVPSKRHLPTKGTRERSELSASGKLPLLSLVAEVGARKLRPLLLLLQLLKLGSLLPAVELAMCSRTSPDFGSRSSLDGLLRRRAGIAG